MIRVGVVNATGYIGAELLRLLLRHPQVKIASITGRSAAGRKIGEVFPHLASLDLRLEEELGEVDLAFFALPHGASIEPVKRALERGIRVVDLSADYRLKEAAEYERWYGVKHPYPELLKEAVYGLSEIRREEIRKARLIANPGCYPTGAILSLLPALKMGLVESDIVIDAKSGVSGAGRTLSLHTHFPEANEGVSAYALKGHRHLPEIEQELGRLAPVSVTFLPHLVPMNRGILTSCYAKLKEEVSDEEVRRLYREFYEGEKFVRVVDFPPQTKHVQGSNLCLIHPAVDRRTRRLLVISCIDNLVKGGAGQAIQNMNIMMGFPEDIGLDLPPLYP